jgi:hypothetical protein
MAQLPREHYLLSKRDAIEKERSVHLHGYAIIILTMNFRLDDQDKMITKVRGGQVLDPLIPKENIHRIADVATGTG